MNDMMRQIQTQPKEDVQECGGFVLRFQLLANQMTTEPHKHTTDHITLVCSGMARLWINGDFQGEFIGGEAKEVKAGQVHMWESRSPNTRLCCIFKGE